MSETDLLQLDSSIERGMLKNEGDLAYSLVIHPHNGTVTVKFSDNDEIQNFLDFNSYLYELSYNYRRRMQEVGAIDDKLVLCEEFLNTAFMYTTDFRRYAKDKENFDKELRLYIEQFEYFKNQYIQRKTVHTITNKQKGYSLSTDEKVIVLSYLGILDAVDKINLPNEKSVALIAKLVDRSFDNLKKSIRNINGAPKAKGAVKTIKTLSNIILFANEIGVSELAEKAKKDLDKISK